MADEYDPAYPTLETALGSIKDELCDGNVMKPEKVKSRWRRSSELECGDYNFKSPELPESNRQKLLGSKDKGSSTMISEPKSSSNSITEKPNLKPCQNNSLNSNHEKKCKVPDFDYLDENQYLFERKRTKRKKEVRRMLCDCTFIKEEKCDDTKGCEDECLNRLLMIECSSRCPTGDACSNKRFQKRQYPKCEPFKTDKKGWGLKLLEDVHAGRFVIEYVGEVLSNREFKQRVKLYAREKSNHYYFMALKSDEIIDATNKGNLSRFINHSCDPNCETQKWTVNGELRIGFFSKRDLKAGEELTFDYQFQRYGREAQKCYCDSELCKGYIGGSKSTLEVEVNHSKTNAKRKKAMEEKKRDVLEDLMVEEEIKKLFDIGGLRNREETLVLARLMVRAEDNHSRIKVLDIILGTTEVACLRLFLDYHGLSLLWSWMVDLTDTKLKTKILQVLSLLPVPNKTMLLDSKVLNVVEKWSSEAPFRKPVDPVEHSAEKSATSSMHLECLNGQVKQIKVSDTSDSETDGVILPTPSELNPSDSDKQNSNNSSEGENIVNLEKVDAALDGKGESASKVARSDDDIKSGEFVNLASSLLDSWKDLKEVFRIPRLEQQKRQEDEREADRYSQKIHSHNTQYNCRSTVSYKYPSRSSYDNRDNGRFSRDSSPYSRDNRFSRDNSHFSRDSSHYSRDKTYRREKGRKRYHYSTYTEDTYSYTPDRRSAPSHSDDSYGHERRSIPSHFDDVMGPPRQKRPLLPIPENNKLSKAERRQLFALEVQQRDHEEALRKQSETAPSESFTSTESFASTESFTSDTSEGVSFDQYYYDPTAYGNSYLLGTAYSPQFPIESQISATATVSSLPTAVSSAQIPAVNSYGTFLPTHLSHPEAEDCAMTDTSSLYSSSIMYHPSPSEIPLPIAPSPALSADETNQALVSCQNSHQEVNQMPEHSSYNNMNSDHTMPQVIVPGAESITTTMPPIFPVASDSQAQTITCHSSISSPGYYSKQGTMGNSQAQQMYYIQPHYSASHITEQACVSQPVSLASTSNGEVPLSPAAVRLPHNWKTATDAEGNIYYYHAVTRETQWDPPEVEEIPEDVDSGTPTYDEPKDHKIETHARSYKKLLKKKSTTTAPADTSSNPITTDIAKKIKELFRTKMSSFIVQCLNSYRKPDCALGRITSTEDFKHLARKLTHFVMAKELKHCKNVEELECNENVKHKARDYVQKYMAKYGPVYRKEKMSPLGE